MRGFRVPVLLVLQYLSKGPCVFVAEGLATLALLLERSRFRSDPPTPSPAPPGLNRRGVELELGGATQAGSHGCIAGVQVKCQWLNAFKFSY